MVEAKAVYKYGRYKKNLVETFACSRLDHLQPCMSLCLPHKKKKCGRKLQVRVLMPCQVQQSHGGRGRYWRACVCECVCVYVCEQVCVCVCVCVHMSKCVHAQMHLCEFEERHGEA